MICERQYGGSIAGCGRPCKRAGAIARGAGQIPLAPAKRSSTAACGVHCFWPTGVLRKWSTTGLMGKTALEEYRRARCPTPGSTWRAAHATLLPGARLGRG